ncbi:MAG TPA: hypothetical protein VEQ61_09045, partial [Thermoleophilaceae bacterium]|nr:hypothetical protein [Thermoleophilaceae bacterium]
MSAAAALGFLAGVTAALGLRELLGSLGLRAGRELPAAVQWLGRRVSSVVLLGREGLDPGALERRRLLATGALCALALGTALAGPRAGALVAGGGAWVASRLLRARREHYRRAVDDGAAQLSLAIADAIGGGRSLRGALAAAAAPAQGAAGHELRRVAAELAAGARTEDALEAMRARVRSPRIDLL